MDDPTTTGTTEGFGLLFYNARWYDPVLGRFNQPDSSIPQNQGTQAWDRYAYVSNNPLRYTDPSGHWEEMLTEGGGGDIEGAGPVGGVSEGGGLPSSGIEMEVNPAASEGSAWLEEAGGYGEGGLGNPTVELTTSEQAYEAMAEEYYEANLNKALDELQQADPASAEAQQSREQIAKYATNNYAEDTVSIGSNGAYQRSGYTYFNLSNNAWKRLVAMGEAENINIEFMNDQMAQGKDFEGVLIREPGPGTNLETDILNKSELYKLTDNTPMHFYYQYIGK